MDNFIDVHAANCRREFNNAPQDFSIWIVHEAGDGLVRWIWKQCWFTLRHFSGGISWCSSCTYVTNSVYFGKRVYLFKASGVCIGTILNSTGTLCLCVAVAFYYHWKLALVCFAIPGVALLIVIGEQFASRKNQGNLQKSVESSAKVMFQFVLGCD